MIWDHHAYGAVSPSIVSPRILAIVKPTSVDNPSKGHLLSPNQVQGWPWPGVALSQMRSGLCRICLRSIGLVKYRYSARPLVEVGSVYQPQPLLPCSIYIACYSLKKYLPIRLVFPSMSAPISMIFKKHLLSPSVVKCSISIVFIFVLFKNCDIKWCNSPWALQAGEGGIEI